MTRKQMVEEVGDAQGRYETIKWIKAPITEGYACIEQTWSMYECEWSM